MLAAGVWLIAAGVFHLTSVQASSKEDTDVALLIAIVAFLAALGYLLGTVLGAVLT